MKTIGLLKRIGLSVLIVTLTLLTLMMFAQPYRISGDCMEPAIKDGKLYFLNRIFPYLRQYQIGDIILFKYEEKVWISRIVALENNTIQINKGSIMINGVMLQDVGVYRSWTNWKHGTYAIDKPLQVPPGYVYVLSDNLSAHHDDSRVFGPISDSSIFGVIW